ncbi:MAG: LPS assembly lipoprotein LptE [Flexibacteraceae bacterium]
MSAKLLKINILLIFLISICLSGCGIYSFTGSALSPDIKTISIETFPDRSNGGPSYISQVFTDKAREYFQSNSKLAILQSNGDLQITGYISGYTLSPVAPTGNNVAAKTRLTITVKVKYQNTKNEEDDFEQDFSFFSDFDQTQTLSAVERGKIEEISDQILLDIFNKTVANW